MAGRRPRKEHLHPALVRANGYLTQTEPLYVSIETNREQGLVGRHHGEQVTPSCLWPTRARTICWLEVPVDEARQKGRTGNGMQEIRLLARRPAMQPPPVFVQPQRYPTPLGRPRYKTNLEAMPCRRRGDDAPEFDRHGRAYNRHPARQWLHKSAPRIRRQKYYGKSARNVSRKFLLSAWLIQPNPNRPYVDSAFSYL